MKIVLTVFRISFSVLTSINLHWLNQLCSSLKSCRPDMSAYLLLTTQLLLLETGIYNREILTELGISQKMEHETLLQYCIQYVQLCLVNKILPLIFYRGGHQEIFFDINMFNKSFSIKTTTKVGTVSDLKVQNVHLLRQKQGKI